MYAHGVREIGTAPSRRDSVSGDRGAPQERTGACRNWAGMMMGRLLARAPAVATVSLLVVGGCATRGDVDALRSEITGLRSSVASADARAANAEAQAQQAAAAAQAAMDARTARAADQAYRRSLRK
jgi:hypothetical protein